MSKIVMAHPSAEGVRKVFTQRQAERVYAPLGWTPVGEAAGEHPGDTRTAAEAEADTRTPARGRKRGTKTTDIAEGVN